MNIRKEVTAHFATCCALSALLSALLVQPASAAPDAVDVANVDCTALNLPYGCCTGSGTGNCDGKFGWLPTKRGYHFIEFCASFWYDIDCGNVRNGVQWLVPGACTQGEADSNAALEVVVCNETKSEDESCRGDLGCTAAGAPFACCTGLNTGTCPFTGSSNTPHLAKCRKVYDEEMLFLMKARRQDGRVKWKKADDGVFVPASEDIN